MHTTFPTRLVALALSASVTISAFAIGAAYIRTTEAQETGSVPTLVTTDNFVEAETDKYFGNIVTENGGLAKLYHNRNLADLERQAVIRMNRDTLYSSAVFDLDAGPVTVTMPDAGDRFMSLMIVNEDHYLPIPISYEAGPHELTRETVGTRYVLVGVRTLVDPNDPADLATVHALQDAIVADQPGGPGTFEVPAWDKASQDTVRAALADLGALLPDLKGMFGTEDQVDEVRHLIGSATAWGGNPDTEATYLNFTPTQNDGTTIYKLHVADVPVDGFWSISLYNAEGYYEPNPLNAYSLNNITAEKNADGSVDVQFGGCEADTPNCLVTMPGWNYLVRLYRPQQAVLDGTWMFPEAQPAS